MEPIVKNSEPSVRVKACKLNRTYKVLNCPSGIPLSVLPSGPCSSASSTVFQSSPEPSCAFLLVRSFWNAHTVSGQPAFSDDIYITCDTIKPKTPLQSLKQQSGCAVGRSENRGEMIRQCDKTWCANISASAAVRDSPSRVLTPWRHLLECCM